MVEEVEILEHHTHPPAHHMQGVSLGQDVLPVEEDLSAGGRFQHIQRPEEGALPRSGRADDADHLTRPDMAVDVFQDLDHTSVRVPETLAEMLDGNHLRRELRVRRFRTRPMSQARTK